MPFLSAALDRVKPSATIAVTDKARALKAAGRNVIGLGAGEPDFDTTPPTSSWRRSVPSKPARPSIPTSAAFPELKEAVIAKFQRENGLSYKPNQVIIGTGGKQVLLQRAVWPPSIPGDEVIIPAPYWVSYPEMVALAGGESVPVVCTVEHGFKLPTRGAGEGDHAEDQVDHPDSPSNPTGAAYTRSELKAITDVLVKHPMSGS